MIANAGGALTIEIDGKPCLDAPKATLDAQVYGLASLEAGWHAWKIKYVPTAAPDLTVLLGGDVVTHPLVGKSVRHVGK